MCKQVHRMRGGVALLVENTVRDQFDLVFLFAARNASAGECLEILWLF
jgi:hypothetical protein